MAIKIEKGIPFPSGKCSTRWPFLQMKNGDSIFVNNVDVTNIRSAARNQQVKIATRRENDGYRVWRIK